LDAAAVPPVVDPIPSDNEAKDIEPLETVGKACKAKNDKTSEEAVSRRR